MAKDKKGKKGREEETGEEGVSQNPSKETTPDNEPTGKSTKKGKKGKRDDSITQGDFPEDQAPPVKDKKTKKQKNVGKDEDDDISTKSRSITSDDFEQQIKETTAKTKKPKKSKAVVNEDSKSSRKKSKDLDVLNLSDLDEDEPVVKSSAPKKHMSAGFGLLDVEDVMDVDDVDDISETLKQDKDVINGEDDEDLKSAAKGGKKSKKKERKKKKEADDEDIDKLLEELAIDLKISNDTKESSEPPADKEKETLADKEKETSVDKEPEPEPEVKKGKKKKKNTDMSADVGTKHPSKGDMSEEIPLKDDQSVNEEKVLESVPKTTNEIPNEDDEEQHTVKTAAQKKKEKKEKEKEKKEKEKLKKAAEYEKRAKKKPAEEEAQKPSEAPKTDEIPSEPKTEIDDESKEEAVDDKKKKKKKKDDDEKKDKKRPGKKTIAAMQEALKKVREEEERLRLEEEEKIKAAEEAERQREEKLRLEQEKKEKKKLKEKEKRERLKAEGKLLTKPQRQQRARMEATLAALREQGVQVPQIGEKKERVPRLGDRKRPARKQGGDTGEETKDEEIASPTQEAPEAVEMPQENVEAPEEEEEEEEDEDVKDAWDETSSEEEEDNEVSARKVEVVIKPKVAEEESESEETDSSEEESEESDESSDSEEEKMKHEEKVREQVIERLRKRREEAELNRSVSKLRSPVVCVLGHVDTGKTKILDKIRRTNVQTGEAGGITQQIGATMVPKEALKEQCKIVKGFTELELKLPGLLIIDTPGHESFSNLRSRGSSLCDIAILVVDIMHGLEPQTIESMNMLKEKKTPFIVALNKIDRLYEWKTLKNRDVQDVIKNQARNTKMEFENRAKDIILQFATQGLNAVLHYENTDPRSYVSMVPTSAVSGDGMGNLMALVVQLTQNMMSKRLAFSEDLQATVLEVKAIPGLGTTIDAILVNGRLKEGDTVVLAGYEGPVVTQIRSLLMPEPLKELRVKNFYKEYKEVEGAQGVKITGKDLDKAIAGLQLLVAHHPDEVSVLKEEVAGSFKEAMGSIRVAERGVYVQASTLGSLEALLEFLKSSKIPFSGIRIGPVVKKDVMKASIMLEHDGQYAVILAFDVKIERDAQELADSLGVKIFQADIIYHLFDRFMEYTKELKNKKREELKHLAVFPCKLRILPQYIFNSRDPIVMGVIVEAGIVKDGTPICVPSKEFLEIGTVTTIEVNHKAMETAKKGQEVCIKIEPSGGEAPKMYGRHFDHTDMLVSKISRQSIDVCKEHFRDDLQKTDWQLMVELKKTFQIL